MKTTFKKMNCTNYFIMFCRQHIKNVGLKWDREHSWDRNKMTSQINIYVIRGFNECIIRPIQYTKQVGAIWWMIREQKKGEIKSEAEWGRIALGQNKSSTPRRNILSTNPQHCVKWIPLYKIRHPNTRNTVLTLLLLQYIIK